MKKAICYLALIAMLSCSDSDDDDSSDDTGNGGGGSGTTTDITDAIFTARDSSCADYVGTYTSSVTDVNNSTSFNGELTIALSGTDCLFTTNSIPNHDFNDGSTSFVTDIVEVDDSYTVEGSPVAASSATELSLGLQAVIFLNGAVLDILPAACYGVGSEPLGQEKIGCGDDQDYAWRYDPMYSGNNFGTDTHNAHAQPSGLYHYHATPLAMYTQTGATAASPVIGFAADGFPVFGPYIDDNGTIRTVTSSYELRSGTRNVSDLGSGKVEGASPGGTYDGTYRDDYVYVAGSGDLDECNGMTKDGVYGYYVTATFPWVINCLKGTISSDFEPGP
ncbi:YHYH protein [Pseudobacteriovorax antillogorgiicola]|uniref:YHYH protein n=1 Tax=Pseudobacteriovorax antillogorgiicola TaxID=1513793 RepID=A0A1Y6CUB4_9BACT|nr:YHYH protein [Pseudobacteriovorax antillogorgiicola]TCS43629.1 YHYH protein [Pseudobacteriovorax antillogorgiicola]SMF80005.1 YHYH protein [Pseudobacteriovorax antillogorgiicola]